MKKGRQLGVQGTPDVIHFVKRFTHLEGGETEDIDTLSSGQDCKAKGASEPKAKMFRLYRTVVGGSIVKETDRGFCGNRGDSRMVCCVPGARVYNVTDRVQETRKGEGGYPEVVVYVGPNDVGRKNKYILERDFKALG